MLEYEKIEGGDKNLFFIHGFLDHKEVFKEEALLLQEQYTSYLINLPNHGKSLFLEEYSPLSVAKALYAFICDLKLEKVSVVAHSFGGRSLMQLSFLYPDVLEKLLIIDISPRKRDLNHKTVKSMKNLLLIMKKCLFLDSYQDIENFLLKNFSYNKHLTNIIIKHYDRDTKKWKINVDHFLKEMPHFFQALSGVYKKDVLLVYSDKSGYINDKDQEYMKKCFPLLQWEQVKGSTHWVHSSQKESFQGILKNYFLV